MLTDHDEGKEKGREGKEGKVKGQDEAYYGTGSVVGHSITSDKPNEARMWKLCWMQRNACLLRIGAR
jgi:hypothetical protein